MAEDRLTGTVHSTVFRNPDNGYSVLSVFVDGDETNEDGNESHFGDICPEIEPVEVFKQNRRDGEENLNDGNDENRYFIFFQCLIHGKHYSPKWGYKPKEKGADIPHSSHKAHFIAVLMRFFGWIF